MWVSKYSKDSDFPTGPLSDGDRVRLLDERVRGWIIEVARNLEKADQHAGYGLLNIILPYFEMIAQCEQGTTSEGKSGSFFKAGLKAVLKAECPPDAVLSAFYAAVRCGCFHDGLAREDVVLNGKFRKAVEVDRGIFLVNPHRLLDAVEAHFLGYVARLRRPEHASEVAKLAAFQAESLADSKARMGGTLSTTGSMIAGTTSHQSISPAGCSGISIPAPDGLGAGPDYGDDTTGSVPP